MPRKSSEDADADVLSSDGGDGCVDMPFIGVTMHHARHHDVTCCKYFFAGQKNLDFFFELYRRLSGPVCVRVANGCRRA